MDKKSGSSAGRPGDKRNGEGFKRKDEKGRPFQYKGDDKKGDKPFKRNATSFDRPAGKDRPDGDRKPSFRKSEGGDSFNRNSDKPYARKPRPAGERFEAEDKTLRDKKPFEKTDGPKPFPKRDTPRPFPKREGKEFGGKEERRPGKFDKRDGGKPSFKEKKEFKPYEKDSKQGLTPRIEDKAFKPKKGESINKVFSAKDETKTPRKRTEKNDEKRPFRSADGKPAPFERRKLKPAGEIPEPPVTKRRRKDDIDDEDVEAESAKKTEEMPLNKYIAHCGVCSRRDAVEIVKEGKVKINDVLVTDPGHKVMPDDSVTINDKKITVQKGMVYILLNKPKDYITTNEDPQGRKTVMDLLVGADAERLFPVGRLDRNTTGLLLITNDGALTQKLAHPSYKVKKIYQATLDKPLTKADSEKIINGVTLEDGVAHVDTLAYLESKNELGLEIHSGRNRIVRRIFEHLGYEVVKLDRVMYGGLTKKNLPRGKWRYLNEREVVLLKHFKS